MLPQFDKMIPELIEPWLELNSIYLGKNAFRPDDESAEWIEKARRATAAFAHTLSRLVPQLDGTYAEEGKLDEFFSNPKKADFLADPYNAVITKLALFTDTAARLTDSKEALNEIQHAYRPLLDRRFKLVREIPTSALLAQIHEFESNNILERCQTLLAERHKHSEQTDDPYRQFDDQWRTKIIEVLSQAMELKLGLYRAAVQRVNIDEYSDTINALGATLSDPISTQEQSEAFLRELEPKMTKALDVLQRQLECLDAYIAMLDDVIKAPGYSAGLRDKAGGRSNVAKAARVNTLHALARTLTYTLSRSSIVDTTQEAEDWSKSWQAEIYGRIYDLSFDVNTCYQGTSSTKYRRHKEVPEKIRPDVAALVAGKASSLIADLQHIEGQLASSSRARALVKQLLPIIEEIETSLIDDFEEARSSLRKSINGSKPHVAKVIEDREAEAVKHAAAHLRSFQARPYEDSPDPSEGLSNATSAQRSSRDKVRRIRQAAARVQSKALEVEQEIEAIPRRLALEEDVLAAFRDLPARADSLVKDALAASRGLPARADSLVEAKKKDGKAPDTPSMSPDTLWRHLKQAHADCENAIADLRESIPRLAADDEFARTASASVPLRESIAAMQCQIHNLIADLSKRAPELSTAAEQVELIVETTTFVQRPTWTAFKELLRNGRIEGVEKTVDRELTKHESGTDYLTEYIIYLKSPGQPTDLMDNRAPKRSETYRVRVHVHHEGKDAKEASACHFKNWNQSGGPGKNSKSPAHYGRVPAYDAPDFIAHLETSLSAPRPRQARKGGRRR